MSNSNVNTVDSDTKVATQARQTSRPPSRHSSAPPAASGSQHPPAVKARLRRTPEEREEVKARAEFLRASKAMAKAVKKNAESEPPKATHMTKVEKAALRLPHASEAVSDMATDILKSFSISDIDTLVAHLNHSVRSQKTLDAAGDNAPQLELGQQVQVISGATRHIGQVGEIVKLQRIRCEVAVPGVNRPVYLFITDVLPVESLSSENDDTQEEAVAEAV